MALSLREESPASHHATKKQESITSLRKVTRVVSKIDDECLKLQHIRFLKNLKELTKYISLENLKKLDPKQLIKMFVDDKELVIGVEFIIHSVFVSAIKVSVDSIAESDFVKNVDEFFSRLTKPQLYLSHALLKE